MSDDLTKTIEELEDDIARFEKLAAEKAQALDANEGELQALAGQLLEAKDGERPALVKKRGDLVVNHGALQAERSEAIRRRDSAYLAIFSLRASQALEEAQRFEELTRAQRKKLDQATRALQAFRNGGRGRLPQAEADRQSVKLAEAAARAQAESVILTRDAGRAGAAYERARAELEEARRELGVVPSPDS